MLTFALPERRKAGFGLLPIHYRMLALGLTRRESVGLVNQISVWVRSRGLKGYLEIVSRHKQAWQDREIGISRVIPGLCRVGKGLPFQTAALHRLSVGNRFRILKLMKNLVKYDEVQLEQWLKFKNSATRPQPEKQWLKYYSSLCVLGSQVYPNKDALSHEPSTPVTEMSDDPGQKTFSPFDTRVSIPRDPEKVLLDSLKAAKLYTCLKQVVPLFESDYRDTRIPRTAGLIGVTQEPGGKGRFFASVHPVWQAYFTPLQAALKFRAYRDPGGCVRDQDRGRSLVARMLGKGKKVFTFDLSDATNVFPLKLQSNWMLASPDMNSDMVYMFESVSRDPFMVSQEIHDKFGEDTLTFTVGQPLGLLPSAMAFHLTHIYLLRGLEIALYGRHRDMFSVLVDDVCIWDETLAHEYRLACDRLGITISEAKSFASAKFSEYLGRLITPGRVHELTTQSPLSFDNALPYIRVMGPGVIREVKDGRARKFLASVAALPSPLGADCGNGVSRSQRMTSRIGKLALVESSPEMKEVKPMGCVTSRVRAILKMARHTTEMVLSPEVLSYLIKLLPRRKSKVAEAHYSHPKLGVLWKNSRGTNESWYLESADPGVLLRTSDTYDALRSWREPNFSSRLKAEAKKSRVYLSSLMKSWLKD